MAWAVAAVAAATVGSSLIGANAANNASDAQAESAAAANATSQKQFDQTREDSAPYRQAGYSSLNKLSDLLGLSGNTTAGGYGDLNKRFTGADLPNEPGYQFGLNEGRKALEGSAAARGGLYSGATLKALTRYGNDYASTKYGDAYNRFKSDQDTTFNRLSGLAGTGQTANNQVAQAGQINAQTIGNNLIGAGNARGSAYIAQGNALQSGINGAAYGFKNAFGSGGGGAVNYRAGDPYSSGSYFGGMEGE